MGGAEGVVLALGALGEARQPTRLAQGADAVAASGEDLVRIGLVAHVPDEAVARGIEQIVEGDGQLDDAEAGAQVAAGHRDGVDRLLAQLGGELRQILLGKFAQILRCLHPIEEGRLRGTIHRTIHRQFQHFVYVTLEPCCKRA